MTIRHLQGQCVSCGRQSPWPHVSTCPYCGEEVLMPRLWVALRRVWVAAFTGALGMVILLPLMHNETGAPIRGDGELSIPSWILLSMASVLFLMPHNRQDVIVCSQRELLAWQVKSFFGSLIMGVSSLIGASQSLYARSDWGVAVACGALVMCLWVSPWFFRLCAWRIWAGTVLSFVFRAA